MDPVGNGVYRVSGVHQSRYLAVPFRHPVDVSAEVQGKIGHVKAPLVADGLFQIGDVDAVFAHPRHEIERELVMSRRNGGVGGEDTALANGRDVVLADGCPSLLCSFFTHDFQGEEARVPLVQMKSRDSGVTEFSECSEASEPKYDLLAKPVAFITTVEMIREVSVTFTVFGKAGVEKEDGYPEAAFADDVETPGTNVHSASFDRHGRARGRFLQVFLYGPFDGFFALRSLLAQLLTEIAFAMEKRHGDHGNPQVGSRADRVPGEHPQTSAVCRHGLLKSYFH